MKIAHRLFAGAALVLALTGVVVGEFDRSSAIVATNQVDVYELAGWIKRGEVVLTDLRDPVDTEVFSLPGAMSLPDTLAFLEAEGSAATVVVFGYEDHRTWYPLQSRGYDVKFFADGVEQWLSKILNPVIYRFAPEEELAEFERHAEISQYFGGIPRYSISPVQTMSGSDQLARVRRGCGF